MSSARAQQIRMWARLGFALFVLAVLVLLARQLGLQQGLQRVLAWIHELGPWAPIAYIVFYIVACVFAIPGSILTLGGGVLFNVLRGTLYVSIGATLGATAAFLVGRYLLRSWIVRKLGGNLKFQALDEAVAREGWKIVVLVRLCPIFPFPVINYGFGITRVSLKEYILASWLGMLPAMIMLTYIGSLAGSLAKIGTGMGRTRTPLEWAFYGVGLIATIVLTIYITRIAKRALDEKTGLNQLQSQVASD
jgi:uncharacterized membrane protein YdjX (TVP38/TMEM64 family)